ncbi:ADP-ribose glycohydrolase OARD1-like [Culicoides brevitarsis]|uniref:ADP-ribose glycohydrolase OARD1-like n=1 Tax=Culicoides brevitarsis TaxID=469753 RepID=UPI00307B2285
MFLKRFLTHSTNQTCLFQRFFQSDPDFLVRAFSMSSGFKFNDIEGDLFSCPKDSSLAHCVAADMRMGAGIAVKFKQLFGQVDKLKSQNQRAGGVAVLKDGERYIYYLVSKNETYSKPTYQDLSYSLEAMRKHMKENNVTKLAMPRIGCGIDGLQWDKVSDLIKEVFGKENVEITIYTFVPK